MTKNEFRAKIARSKNWTRRCPGIYEKGKMTIYCGGSKDNNFILVEMRAEDDCCRLERVFDCKDLRVETLNPFYGKSILCSEGGLNIVIGD